MINIHITDDHPVVRTGLKHIIAEHKDMKVICESENGLEMMTKLLSTAPNVLILDITMPGVSGLALLEQLKREHPEIRVLILSMHQEEQFAIRALKAGAFGFLNKDSIAESLIEAIRIVASGEKYISSRVAQQLAFDIDKDKEEVPYQRLSNREFQILRMIGFGKTVSEISEELHLSVSTISTYRARILVKMELKNNSELMRYAIQEKLLD
ncbi:MAG: response regulator transcription factor [Bacteroidetes bacterium]|nr:response regulator transcription factor [Bacteroidota bacterium]